VAGSAINLWQAVWPAPAKLNLFLHVVGRRPDGYHLLQTVFRLIDCCDRIRFDPRNDGKVRLLQPIPGVPEESEFCVRAARLLQQETRCGHGVTITLSKSIPVGGGLGGGSSDAATTLMALTRMWDIEVSRARLAELALGLGADVPFFLLGQNAFGEGVGERLTQIDLPPAWYVVLVPPVEAPTAEIYADSALTRDTKSIKILGFSDGFGHNDLEPVVCRRYPVVSDYLGWLRGRNIAAARNARLTGSGACVFAEFSTEREALAVLANLPQHMRGFAARGLDRHPILGMLE